MMQALEDFFDKGPTRTYLYNDGRKFIFSDRLLISS